MKFVVLVSLIWWGTLPALWSVVYCARSIPVATEIPVLLRKVFQDNSNSGEYYGNSSSATHSGVQ